MNPSINAKPGLSRGWKTFLLFAGFLLFPIGSAPAQEPDYQAVHRRLRAAIEAGEITPPQARVMLQALRDSQAEAAHDRGARRGERAERERAERDRPAKAERSAERSRLEREMKPIQVSPDDPRLAKYREFQGKLRRAVAAGEMNEEQAKKRLMAARRDLFAKELEQREARYQAERRHDGEHDDDGDDDGDEDGDEDEAAEARLEHAFAEFGIQESILDKVEDVLEEQGLNDDQEMLALRGMLRHMMELDAKGDDRKMSPELAKALHQRGLNEKQIGIVDQIGRQLLGLRHKGNRR